jgi:RNA polymerase sigma-70 factor (ECF subfamily)
VGDQRAFAALVERHFGAVFVIGFAHLSDPEAAEDLAQEVFLRAHLWLDRIDPPERFAAWISQVARNVARTWVRNRRRRSRLLPMVPLNEAAQETMDSKSKGARETMEIQEQSQAIRDAILRLPTKLRVVVMLHYTEGLSQAEIARRLGRHPSTITRQLRKALATMKGILEPILREQAPALGAPRPAAERTLALIAAVGAMSATEKAALAAAASLGSLTATSAGALGADNVLSALLGKGGLAMGTGKAVSIVVASVAVVVSGVVLTTQTREPVSPGGLAPHTTIMAEESRSSAQELPEETIIRGDAPAAAPAELVTDDSSPSSRDEEFGPEAPAPWHSRVHGRVMDEHGQPIAEALVTLVDQRQGLNHVLHLTQTDFDGHYEIRDPHRLRSGDSATLLGLMVAAEAPGQARVAHDFHVRQGTQEEVEINFELAPGGTLAGRVVWESGEPVAYAEILVRGADSGVFHEGGTLQTGSTDWRGRFRIQGLTPFGGNKVAVSVAPPGEPFRWAGNPDVGWEEWEIVLREPIGVIEGQTIGVFSDAPVSGETVWLGSRDTDIGANPDDAWTAISDEGGCFRFDQIPFGEWTVVLPDRAQQQNVSLRDREPTATVVFHLPEPVEVGGVVVDLETGQPVPDLALSIGGAGATRMARTDAEGRFHVADLPARRTEELGRYENMITVGVRLRGHDWLFTDGSDYQPCYEPSAENLLSLRLGVRRAQTIRVTAVDPEGHHIPGVNVRLVSDSRESGVRLGRPSEAQFTTFSIPTHLNQFRLCGWHEDWPLLLSPPLGPEDRTATLEAFPLAAALEITVLDAQGEPVKGFHVVARPTPTFMGDQVLPLNRWALSSSSIIGPVETDAEGLAVLIDLPRCPQTVYAHHIPDQWLLLNAMRRAEYSHVGHIDLTSVVDRASLTIRLEHVTHRGQVVETNTGAPLEGATVSGWGSGQGNTLVTTGPDGWFEITGTPTQFAEGILIEA